MARIAVIGAGMGALAAAARLATGGHRVTVFERSQTYGGGLGRYERDGFRFDTGPGLLHLPAVYRDLFVKTGREPLESCVDLLQVDPAIRHVFADGTAVSLPNASRGGAVSALDAAIGPGAGERWADFLGRAREVWDATRRPLLEDALPTDTAPLRRDPYPAPPVRRGLFRRGAPTLAEVAARELGEPRLAAMLSYYAWAYGFDPDTAPASAAVLPYMEHTFGTWYVAGGMRALAEAVHARCVARGVGFRFGAEAEVVGVVEKAGRAAGVELADGTREDADVVVAGVDPRRLTALLRDAPTPPAAAGTATGTGRFAVFLALRGARPSGVVHRTVVHGGGLVVTVLRPDDAALRPDDGHEAVTLRVTVASSNPDDPDRPDAFADRVAAVADAAIADLRLPERLLWRAIRTPAADGIVPGPALAGSYGSYLRPANVSALPGLYLIGGWAHPGGGLAHAGMGGAIVADLVSGGPGGSR